MACFIVIRSIEQARQFIWCCGEIATLMQAEVGIVEEVLVNTSNADQLLSYCRLFKQLVTCERRV
jgi:hypothetical protein